MLVERGHTWSELELYHEAGYKARRACLDIVVSRQHGEPFRQQQQGRLEPARAAALASSSPHGRRVVTGREFQQPQLGGALRWQAQRKRHVRLHTVLRLMRCPSKAHNSQGT